MKAVRMWVMALALSVVGAAFPPEATASARFGDLVQITHLNFHPDTLRFPGDNFAVLVVQNREDGPIQHEVLSEELFQPGTLISVQGTGKIEYAENRVSRVILFPGEEVVIWFYAEKGRSYNFTCDLNGHAMKATIETF